VTGDGGTRVRLQIGVSRHRNRTGRIQKGKRKKEKKILTSIEA
jgi:hypothetical protein